MKAIDNRNLTITIVCDNYPYKQGLENAWGFSALITGTEKSILFDTGPDGEMLMRNITELQIDPNNIDIMVLSHKHPDHTGGLVEFLIKNRNVEVYLLDAFDENLRDKVRMCGTEPVNLTETTEICLGVSSTGFLGRLIKEQALIINTDKGIIVLIGCAHPGILNMATFAKEYSQKEILLLLGGFHLEWTTSKKLQKIIADLQELSVKYVAPAHCTGKRAKKLFKEHFKESYIDVGTGRKINISEL
ncbi:MAG: MBL fold metallo-hydrolase [Planctomycetota bacterium]|jgi:7,8-dihydropterin-6-yl-methyl-4-(beta-D-ribofuranosyl)aminobenzene 5'-phosphate synthase